MNPPEPPAPVPDHPLDPASAPAIPSPEPAAPSPLPAPSSPTPASMPTPSGTEHPEHSSALEVVLQWLTYVFWFWTLCILSTVLSGSLAYFILDNASDSEWIAYMFAPLMILLPAAVITDHYYKKIEPPKKRGFAAVIMVINAVIACVAAVGSLIVAAVTVTSLFLDSGSSDTRTVTIVSSLVVAAMSLLFFLRIIYIERLEFIRKKFGVIMGGVVAITIILTIAGPLMGSAERRTDRLIEENYYSITRGIENYAQQHKALPDSLNDIDYSGDAAEAIATGHIEYKKSASIQTLDISEQNYSTRFGQSSLNYELCITWDYEKGSFSSYDATGNYYGGSHKAGEQCYDESTRLY